MSRQQTARVTFRLIPELHQKLIHEAEAASLTVGSLVKSRLFGEAANIMKTKPARPATDIEELRKILGQLGKLGSNLNQIARSLNKNNSNFEQRELNRMRIELVIIREAVMKSIGITWDSK